MKTKMLKSSLAVCATICMFLAGCSTTAKAGNKYVFDKKETSEVVYTLDESNLLLTRKLKYEYNYDAQGEMIEKKAYRWSQAFEEWVPYYQLKINTSHSMRTLEYAAWDKQTGSFRLNQQRVCYSQSTDGQPLIYAAYYWDVQSKEWKEDMRILLQDYFADNF